MSLQDLLLVSFESLLEYLKAALRRYNLHSPAPTSPTQHSGPLRPPGPSLRRGPERM